MSVARILVLNPGSTSTKVAVFLGGEALLDVSVEHPKAELSALGPVAAQLPLRLAAIEHALAQAGLAAGPFDAVAGRGGLLRPVPGGVYAVTPAMLDDLAWARHGEHPCNLGAPLALELSRRSGCPAWIADPPVTDELDGVARLGGLPELPRRSVFHALSQKAAARRACLELGKPYAEARLLVAHMGGGISVAAHRLGRCVDVVNALDGDGPMTPERSGGLPALGVLDLLASGRYTPESLRRTVLREGGMFAYLGTNDLREALARAQSGDASTAAVVEAMAYQTAKELCGLAPALMGTPQARVDAVVLTGGMAHATAFTDMIVARLSFLAPVLVYPGSDEMLALAQAAARALAGEERVLDYPPESEG